MGPRVSTEVAENNREEVVHPGRFELPTLCLKLRITKL
jgi:hypothetical protein